MRRSLEFLRADHNQCSWGVYLKEGMRGEISGATKGDMLGEGLLKGGILRAARRAFVRLHAKEIGETWNPSSGERRSRGGGTTHLNGRAETDRNGIAPNEGE